MAKNNNNKQAHWPAPGDQSEVQLQPESERLQQSPDSDGGEQQQTTEQQGNTSTALGSAMATAEASAASEALGSAMATATAIPELPDLDALMTSLSPEQLTRIRQMATAKGIAAPSALAGSRKNIDGSMDITIHLDPPVVEQLAAWAEAEGVTLEEEARQKVTESMNNYMYGDWSATRMEPVAAAAATNANANANATGTGTGTGAGAGAAK